MSTYATIKRNMVLVPAAIWINHKQIALNERKQS